LFEILEKHKFTPFKIYNLDETANTTLHTPVQVVASIKQAVLYQGKEVLMLHSSSIA
jgi:hypothetical protein